MGKKSSVSILCFLTITFSAISVSAQNDICDKNSGNFKPNSPYDKNRRLILSTLPSNVTAHHGYFNGSVGLGPDRIYAMGMCAPGVLSEACSFCIEDASKDLLHSCLNQTDAFSWFGLEILCLVRYSSKSFSGVLVLDPYRVFYNYMDIETEVQNEFYKVWDGLMSRMMTVASSYVRNSSSTSSSSSLASSSSKYYAKDAAPLPVYGDIDYGDISVLMQCTPDISSEYCKLCLQRSVDYYKTWYYGKRGAIIVQPSCFFRWELFIFSGGFESTTNVTSSPVKQQNKIKSSSPVEQQQQNKSSSPVKKQQKEKSSPPSSPPPPSVANLTKTTKKDKRISGGIVAAIVICIVITILLIASGLVIFKRRKQNQAITPATESVQFDLKTIDVATSNFSESNKLGEGGFGEVYKGILPDGTEVAVKRLSKTSGQGEAEFKNEVLVVAKLQHRNLVRLLGFSLQRDEKLIVYEFVPNKSLDFFLFDSMKRAQLDWTARHNIINGITRGILYLHQDSRLTIIHRDLKASNILLDANMNPKISDFGMARIFEMDQGGANTRRVVGTFGYMSPEYVTHGQFSTKSDVYSFGVLILEIISGKKNSSFNRTGGSVNNLVTYAWKLWKNNSLSELIDPGIQEECIVEVCKKDEITRCIHIGLLCVQENPKDRPAMSKIHQMLTNSSLVLPVPRPPGFFFPNGPGWNSSAQESESSQSTSKSFTCSVDEATITNVTPR